VLSIAGSDSAGAAGAQTDLKTFVAMNVHGLSAITAVTAQSLRRVASVHIVPAREVARQIHAVFADFDVCAVKIGMLGSAANAAAVAAALRQERARNIVLDPVLASSSGTPLLTPRGLAALRKQLLPLADLLTPNLPEAAILLGRHVRDADAPAAARDLLAMGARAVLLKGGHGRGTRVRDVFADARGIREFVHPRLQLRARGTGCMLASAIAAGLAQGLALPAAIAAAEAFLQHALRDSYRVTRTHTRVLRPRQT